MTYLRQVSLTLLLTCIVALTCGAKSENDLLEGCIEPTKMATALQKLHQADWRKLSLSEVQAFWPTELSYKDCTAAGCSTVWAMDRIIAGYCQCCVSFHFEVQGTSKKPRSERLGVVVLKYATQQKSDLIAIAKNYAAALGMPTEQLTTVGQEAQQGFSWRTGPSGQELSSIEFWFNRDEDRWEFTLYISQNIKL